MIQKTLTTILVFLFLLTGCVHKMDIEQGNILSSEKLNQIHTGMTKEEIKNVLGEPILAHTLINNNQLNYVYTSHPGRGKTTEKNLTLVFNHHERLQQIKGNLSPTYTR